MFLLPPEAPASYVPLTGWRNRSGGGIDSRGAAGNQGKNAGSSETPAYREGEGMAQRRRGEGDHERPWRALRYGERVRMVAAGCQRLVTANELADQMKIPRAKAREHIRSLRRARWLRVACTKTVRGVQRHYYEARRAAFFTDADFARLAKLEKHEVTAAVLDDLIDRFRKAFRGGTLDRRSDSHLSWIPLLLDERGWKDLIGLISQAFDRAQEIQAEASVRLEASGETPIPTTIALAGFESPPEELS